MPQYQPGFDEEGFGRLKDALVPLVQAGVTDNAGDVATVLGDLADLGYLRALGGDPPRWELARAD
jgi:hypothetical protein